MPIPLGYSRAVLHGTLRGGEIFQWGIWCSEAPDTAQAATDNANAVQQAFLDTTSGTPGPLGLIATDAAYKGVRVYSYPSGGPDATYVGEATMNQPGTGTGDLPDQTSLVVTLETGLAGRRHRGRFYLPCTGLALSSGQLTADQASGVAAWAANFLTAVNAAVTPGFVVVLSQVAGSAQRVTGVTVDSRTDVQRRRADRENIISTASHAV